MNSNRQYEYDEYNAQMNKKKSEHTGGYGEEESKQQ